MKIITIVYFKLSLLIFIIIIFPPSCKLSKKTVSLRTPDPSYNNQEDSTSGSTLDRPTIYSAVITKNTKAYDYTGKSCDLSSGLKFKFVNYIDIESNNIEFELDKPNAIKDCMIKRNIIVNIDAIKFLPPLSNELIKSPTQYQQFRLIDHKFNFDLRSWSKIISNSTQLTNKISDFFFPLASAPYDDYKIGGRQFGAQRNPNNCGARRHAAVDLTANPGTEVRAVTNGTILDSYRFYENTYALVVDHYDFIIRYGEVTLIDGKAPKHSKNDQPVHVKAGEVIAKVGLIQSSQYSMLHLEIFKGSLDGNLSSCITPFQRREDLLDPTDFVDKLIYQVSES